MVITSLYQKGNALVKFDKHIEALVAYTQTIEKLEKNNNPEHFDSTFRGFDA